MKQQRMLINTILNLDCLTGMRLLPDATIPLTVTSPPYDGVRDFGEQPWDFDVFRAIAGELWRVTTQGGVVVWVVADQIKRSYSGTSFRQALHFMELGFWLHDIIVIQKSGSRWPGKTRYGTATEFAFILSKGTPRCVNLIRDRPNKHVGKVNQFVRRETDGRLTKAGDARPIKATGVRRAVWEYAAGNNHTTKDRYAFGHSALMPEKLAADLIVSWSQRDDLVFDPMAGAGTTCKMALLGGRRYLGLEVHEPYYRLALRRMEDANVELRRQLDAWLKGA